MCFSVSMICCSVTSAMDVLMLMKRLTNVRVFATLNAHKHHLIYDARPGLQRRKGFGNIENG